MNCNSFHIGESCIFRTKQTTIVKNREINVWKVHYHDIKDTITYKNQTILTLYHKDFPDEQLSIR